MVLVSVPSATVLVLLLPLLLSLLPLLLSPRGPSLPDRLRHRHLPAVHHCLRARLPHQDHHPCRRCRLRCWCRCCRLRCWCRCHRWLRRWSRPCRCRWWLRCRSRPCGCCWSWLCPLKAPHSTIFTSYEIQLVNKLRIV